MTADGDGFVYVAGSLAVAGVAVGCATDARALTGVTVVLLPPGSRGAVDVAGGGPATRETEALRPENLVPGPHAIVLAGGSAMGLAAADGVVRVLRARRVGFAAGAERVPIVPAAAIFDLGVGEARAPTAADGEAALLAARAGPVSEGRVGAGTGASVGKLVPGEASPGGQGAVTLVAADGLRVGALCVVNAVGSVVGADGRVLAGPRAADGAALDPLRPLAGAVVDAPHAGDHTTLAVVVTNAALDKAALARVARMAHDGLARAIEPAHTLWDGDTVFAIACGDAPPEVGPGGRAAADPSRVGAIAARAVATAIRRAVAAASAHVPA